MRRDPSFWRTEHAAGRPPPRPKRTLTTHTPHAVRNKAEAAYARSEFFEKQRAPKESWSRLPRRLMARPSLGSASLSPTRASRSSSQVRMWTWVAQHCTSLCARDVSSEPREVATASSAPCRMKRPSRAPRPTARRSRTRSRSQFHQPLSVRGSGNAGTDSRKRHPQGHSTHRCVAQSARCRGRRSPPGSRTGRLLRRLCSDAGIHVARWTYSTSTRYIDLKGMRSAALRGILRRGMVPRDGLRRIRPESAIGERRPSGSPPQFEEGESCCECREACRRPVRTTVWESLARRRLRAPAGS